MGSFVHLHVHSDSSLLDASASVGGLADRAAALGMTHLALTDHGNMFGVMEFIAACGDRVKPIIGCEAYVSPGSRHEKKGSENENRYYHLVLLATNREGYFNLAKLCSLAYTEGFYYRPRIDEELLEKHHGGLIALSGCVSGEIPMLIRAGKPEEAAQKAAKYRDLFGADALGNPNFYLEIQDHGIDAEALRGGLSQREINGELAKVSKKTGVPLVATNDVHYIEREDYVAHDILLCIGTGKKRTDEKRKKYHGSDFYMKSAEEMAGLFPDYPEAIANTVRIAERCVADVPKITEEELAGYLPDFGIPEGFGDMEEYLRHLAAKGLAERYPGEKAEDGERWKEIRQRLDYELDIIIDMGFAGYFLIVEDFIRWAREQKIPVGPGRGSGVGSVVAYSLRITDVEPFRYGLIFERFLNKERFSMPDFDVDFPKYGRDDVIRYVTEKYGKERVGQIITFATLKAKAVTKDVARTLDIPYADSENITKLIPSKPGVTLKQAFEGEPKLRELEKDPRYTELFSLARKLEGLKRQPGLHASGVVIGRADLDGLVPLYKDSETKAIATQYSMGFLEKCGLVKMDFLGLQTIDLIKHAEDLVRDRGGGYAGFSAEDVPEDDEATFRMLGEGHSFGIFQFESEGHRNNLRRTKPGKIEDLIALNALYRPGPMKYIDQFIDSKNGRQAITYPHPSLEDVLKETYGVIVYQEQVMRVARIIAGFSMGQADVLRAAMGKKKRKIIDEMKVPFIAGAVERGLSKAKAAEIYDKLEAFAEYGFNKSHAAAYSVVAYRTAYLKANFPAEFMAANLSNEIKNKDKLSECIDEARKMGIAIDPPDVNRSGKLFTIVGGRIVYGLLGINGVGESAAEEIVGCRQGGGPYKDFMDFLNRVDTKVVGKAALEKLVNTGAFDLFGEKRGNLQGNLERAIDYAQKQKDDRQFGQTSLFGDTDEKEYADFVFESFPDQSQGEKLKLEKQLIGLYLSGHPLDEHRELWQKAVKVDLGKPETIEPGSQILMGIVKEFKVVNSKSGKMAYATLADYNGEIEMVFFAKVWERCQDRFEKDEIAIFRGKIDFQQDKERYSFTVDGIVNFMEAEDAIAEESALAKKREKYRAAWLYMADLKSSTLASAEKGSYTVVGQLVNLREKQDRNGNEMAFATLKDFDGDMDLVFFSKVWEKNRDLVTQDEFVALKGTIDPSGDRNRPRPSFMVSSVKDITGMCRSAAAKADAGEEPKVPASESRAAVSVSAEAPEQDPPPPPPPLMSVHIRLGGGAADRDETMFPLRNYLAGHPGPCPVFIHVPISGDVNKTIRVDGGLSIEAEKEALGVLEGCIGVAKAWKEKCK